jgi:hypothetical protein
MTGSLTSMLDLTRSKATTLSVILPDKGYDVEMTLKSRVILQTRESILQKGRL